MVGGGMAAGQRSNRFKTIDMYQSHSPVSTLREKSLHTLKYLLEKLAKSG